MGWKGCTCGSFIDERSKVLCNSDTLSVHESTNPPGIAMEVRVKAQFLLFHDCEGCHAATRFPTQGITFTCSWRTRDTGI